MYITKSDPPKVLTDEEEEELVSFLCKLADIGYPKTTKQVVDLVNQIAIIRAIPKLACHGETAVVGLEEPVSVLYRCQVFRNVQDSPGSGSPFPCSARNLLFS